ncbi:hypothetical protein B9479_007166 [Cryptococcus floricola]|uniref:Vacuolar protein sorting-associated protein 27 n=1 Tax=Cryptococcus floricola TaxID=2591691 RepID=A0A5D3AL54_9TREE|nr:hypothetical protein B9479_007166 [Cryptococcus floricola]
MSWLWGPSVNPQFEELSEKACSPNNLPYPQSEDMATALEVADMVRAKTVPPKLAMQSLKRRIASKNGRVQMYAISLTDTCIKNGGDHFLIEIASKEFVDEIAGLIRSDSTSREVVQMLLVYFQQWAVAFRSKAELSFLSDVYNELKASGVPFPPPPQSIPNHLLTTITAPTWNDSEVCTRCKSAFTFTNRKHHCRNCGLIFDQACSSHNMPLPKYGITEEVRVCDGCWIKSGKGKEQVVVLPPPAPAVPERTRRSRSDFDADLQRAIELSLAETQSHVHGMPSEPPLVHNAAEDDDEQMRLAIEASLRDAEARPSAPTGYGEEPELPPLPTFDLNARESETVLTFSNTMDQMSAYGERDLRRFPHAHVLAEQAGAVGEKLRRNVEEKSTKQQMLMEMQDKLSQAINIYGGILDGQQAFAARRAQDEQARRYQQQQGMYYGQQQQYQPYGYQPPVNGYQQFAAPQPAYQPPQAQPQSSLYPSMPYASPSFNQPQMYPAHQNHAWSPVPTVASPIQQVPHQPGLSRHVSLQTQPVSPVVQPVGVQRQTSMTYGAPAISSHPSQIRAQPNAPQEVPSAPPPVNLSTHPASPIAPTQPLAQAQDIPSAPSAPPQFSPEQTASAPPGSVGSERTLEVTSPELEGSAPAWEGQGAEEQATPVPQQHQQSLYSQPPSQAQPQGQYQPPQSQSQQQQQQQQQHLPPGVYNAASFPQPLPPTIFPDAPVEAPAQQGEVNGLEKQEKEEALLIEL